MANTRKPSRKPAAARAKGSAKRNSRAGRKGVIGEVEETVLNAQPGEAGSALRHLEEPRTGSPRGDVEASVVDRRRKKARED
jgi:hypothetical protein